MTTWNFELVKRVTQLSLVVEGGRLPRGYGVAWWRPNEAVAVCLPVGLHILASAVRAAYIRFRLWRIPDERERAFTAGYERGRETGRRQGELLGRMDAEREVVERERVVREVSQELRAIVTAVRGH